MASSMYGKMSVYGQAPIRVLILGHRRRFDPLCTLGTVRVIVLILCVNVLFSMSDGDDVRLRLPLLVMECLADSL